MPEHAVPGAHTQEIQGDPPPIEPVPTDVAGFVGPTRSGPTAPQRIRSWREHLAIFGKPVESSFLGPAVQGFFENGGRSCWVAPAASGRGGDRVTAADYVGDRALSVEERTGLAALEAIDSIAILSVPDEVRRTPTDLGPITAAAIEQCERLRDRVYVTSMPAGQRDVAALPQRPDTSYAALYHPWIETLDPATEEPILVPPSGHVAGVYARTSLLRGVHEAPANEIVHGATDLELAVTQDMQDALNPLGINCLRDFRSAGRGIRVWGARTLSSDPEWKYVNVRRLFLFLEQSIDEGTQWAVFEPNDEPLWKRVRRAITSFLADVWRSGALQGSKPDEAFFVRCDRTTMTRDDVENDRLIAVIGFAPLKPAEFVIFRFSRRLGVKLD